MLRAMQAPAEVVPQVFERARTLRVNNVDAFVADTGAGPDAVFLHGNPDTHEVWSEVIGRLGPFMRCFAPDMPGFGRSRAPRGFDCSLANQAAFVEGLVEQLGLRKIHLVVHDVGGLYGLAFAALHPERIASLTIFNCSFFPDYRWHFWARVWRTRGLGELAMAVANRPLFVREMKRGSPNMPKDYARRAYDRFGRDAKRMVLRWYRAMDYASVLKGWDERLLAATRETPKQVLWGDRDPFIPPATADRYQAAVHRFAKCGHWVMLEKPEETATLIRELVARTS